MARQSKIEQLGLQKLVAQCVADGKNPQEIAAICSRKSRQRISNMAVRRYLDTVHIEVAAGAESAPVVKRVDRSPQRAERVQRAVNRDLDIIDLQYRTTTALVEKFELLDTLPEMVEKRLGELASSVDREDLADYLDTWADRFVRELRRNVQLLAIVNRELRENAKFIADLRERAFEYSLIEEYLSIFMDIFRRESPEAYERAEMQIASNPRLQWIVEQQQQMRGFADQ